MSVARVRKAVSPLVVIEVFGGGKFRCAVGAGEAYSLGAAHVTRPVSTNGSTPRWNETCEVVAEQPEDAILSIHVYDRERKESNLLGYQCIPMTALRTGWRVVSLRSPTGSRLVLGKILVHISKELRKGTPANVKCKKGGGALGAISRSITRAPGVPSRSATATAANAAGGYGGGGGGATSGSGGDVGGGGVGWQGANALSA